jgi:hypothetical protein
MKLLAQYIKRSHDFLWSADIDTSSALRRRLVLTLRTAYAVGRATSAKANSRCAP